MVTNDSWKSIIKMAAAYPRNVPGSGDWEDQNPSPMRFFRKKLSRNISVRGM
jgi:hypothetical protein